jgi:poly(glycerol-phosphate) alpha-glucosyltransferase
MPHIETPEIEALHRIEMPEGQYFALTGRIHPGSGGQTRALLMRNRLFAQWAGIEPVLLTLDDAPKYPQFRETLHEQGQLIDRMRLLNIFEWYRDNSVDDLETTGEDLPPVEGLAAVDVPHPDGSVYQTRHVQRHGGETIIIDYRRQDGSVYLRTPAGSAASKSLATNSILANSKGEQVGNWPTQRGWRKNWIISLLAPDQRAFLICDSRFAIADILPLQDDRLHILHLVHNIHLQAPYIWSSPVLAQYRPLFSSIQHLDGLVTLTQRQRADVSDRFGATDNMFVVPNPVESPALAHPCPDRDAKRFAMVTRLENQKRLEDAVHCFALVLKEEPGATLDIYGEGRLGAFLESEIEALGIRDSVTLHGHDPRARDALWTATGMLLTSRFEGYPLATLESMSHGCPVISYDIKYGPREQISHGVDGFLVEPGDLAAMAKCVVQLIRSPDLVATMSAAACEKALRHDHRALLDDWRYVLLQVIDKREYRTALTSVTLEVSRLGYPRSWRLPERFVPERFGKSRFLRRLTNRRASSAGFRTTPRLEFTGRLQVKGTSPSATLDDVMLSLDAVSEASGAIVSLPLQVERSGEQFQLSSHFDPADLFGASGKETRALRLRLRLVWHNSSWETTLARPRRMAPNYEFSYADDGRLTLLRGARASAEADADREARTRKRESRNGNQD